MRFSDLVMKRWFACFLLCVALASCSDSHGDGRKNPAESADSESAPVIVLDSLREGMMRIIPNGASSAYSLGIHEVTCSEFDKIAKDEDWYFALDCANDKLPVTNVSYYDVVLFANAYSRLFGYDSVYAYHRPFFNAKGHCINLEGLEVRSDVEGFRLPTEAEWVMAASQSWNPEKYSWNSTNSNFELHEPCAFPDSIGFCDLAGNALELTNDWFGSLEKVVKGGMMVQAPSEMNLNTRGDVYPVTPSTLSGYIGFRLAFGKIPEATGLDEQNGVATNYMKMKAFSSDVREKVGTYHSKLAFRNNVTGNLVYIDYDGRSPGAIEIFDTVQVFHPDISPDGSKVAFCTGMEGVDGPSSVYVRNLDANGGGLVKLDVEKAVIPRWHVSEGGDTSIVFVDDASDNSDDAEFLARGTWIVPFSNGKFGQAKKLMDGAYHSGVSQSLNRAVSGARRLRVHVNGKDDVWYNGEQACNASLSKDGLNQTLFLDFGGSTGRAFASDKYGVHERLLVADSSGKMVRAIPAPKGFSFDHSEWVNRDNLAVVSLVNVQGEHAKLALVNVLDSSVTELVEGGDLWHPNMWVMPKNTFGNKDLDLDSAGLYWDPIYQGGERSASLKMRMFWDERDSLEVIAVGTSRTERGFDPTQISKSALNFGYVGGNIWAALYLMDNYFIPHAKNLKYLIVEISYDLMHNSKASRMQFAFGQAPGYFYDRNHNFWRNGLPQSFVRFVDANVCYTGADSLNYVNMRGLLMLEPNCWSDEPEIKYDTVMQTSWQKNYDNSVDSLTAFIDSTQNKGFKIIGLVYPQSPGYANTGSFGRHGTKRSQALKTAAYFDSLAQVYPHFIMVDENKFGMHDYTDDMANDCDHLSFVGAKHLSSRLDSLIKTLEK
ncbi:hypothetical protein Fisuc_1208 [Fibrobacter succinogenes subsp. succinogenes S85]|uniref:Sulfatase-modifying factor enzyme-like domain-containing protein n=2 Tax=Fibrobacter succinogenes TaxID=833 RepID=A0ABN3YWN9_FIBSS|nr:hypothetical protein Fisuc_1208 [Fibrobacter succinogenes subsp. succinogenes S85]